MTKKEGLGLGTTVNTDVRKSLNKDDVLFPDEVRHILNTNNDEIKRLCRQVNISPKKDAVSGKTFFLKDDVEILRRVKELHLRGQKIAQDRQKLEKSLALKQVENPIQTLTPKATIDPEIKTIVKTIVKSQENIVEKLSKIIDEKLDGMDEVVVELIRCKTENENLRFKLNELTKENYLLKKEADSYKSLGLGLYYKKNDSDLL